MTRSYTSGVLAGLRICHRTKLEIHHRLVIGVFLTATHLFAVRLLPKLITCRLVLSQGVVSGKSMAILGTFKVGILEIRLEISEIIQEKSHSKLILFFPLST